MDEGTALAVGWLLAGRRILERLDDGLLHGQSSGKLEEMNSAYRFARTIVPNNES